ncbi:MAG: phasin family protein [Granulosicoccus sp.]
MKSVNEQFAEMQKKTMESLEPIQNLNTVAAQAFERIARKNYDLMGDLVDYAVTQVKLPAGEADVQQVYEQRVADTKAFAEKVNERAAEYVALAGELGDMVTTSASPSTQATKPAAKKKAPVAKKTAAKKRAAKAK